MRSGRPGAWTRAAGTWAASSTGATGKDTLPGLLLIATLALQSRLGSQKERPRNLQGQRDGAAQHRARQAVLVSLSCFVCGWLSSRHCCLPAVQTTAMHPW